EDDEQEAERQPEQEPHLRRPHGAERLRQLPLLRIAQHLADRGDHRENGPQARHVALPSCPTTDPHSRLRGGPAKGYRPVGARPAPLSLAFAAWKLERPSEPAPARRPCGPSSILLG